MTPRKKPLKTLFEKAMLITSMFSFSNNVLYTYKGRKQNLNNINSLSNDKIFDWTKLKEFADDNFKFDENDRQKVLQK